MSLYESRWKPGDTIGSLTVLRVIGREQVRKHKRVWVYLMQCACGAEERIHQERLVEGRRSCTDCTKQKARSRAIATWKSPAELPPWVPDFARLRLLSDEMAKRLMEE